MHLRVFRDSAPTPATSDHRDISKSCFFQRTPHHKTLSATPIPARGIYRLSSPFFSLYQNSLFRCPSYAQEYTSLSCSTLTPPFHLPQSEFFPSDAGLQLPPFPPPDQTRSLVTHIEHEAARHLHLLVLIVLELQPAHVIPHPRHFGPIERRRLRVSGQDVFADGVVGQDGIAGRDGDEGCRGGFVDLARGAVLVGLGVLDFVPGRSEAPSVAVQASPGVP